MFSLSCSLPYPECKGYIYPHQGLVFLVWFQKLILQMASTGIIWNNMQLQLFSLQPLRWKGLEGANYARVDFVTGLGQAALSLACSIRCISDRVHGSIFCETYSMDLSRELSYWMPKLKSSPKWRWIWESAQSPLVHHFTMKMAIRYIMVYHGIPICMYIYINIDWLHYLSFGQTQTIQNLSLLARQR